MTPIPSLPLDVNLDTIPILKKLSKAHRALAELKGVTGTIPNQEIVISTLSLQEAKQSSEIENIITTHDELYKSDAVIQNFTSQSAKEVHSYARALRLGFERVRKDHVLSNADISNIQSIIVENSAGFRSQPGTELKNAQSGEVVYTPPQDPNELRRMMDNLEQFINHDDLSDQDPLVKMAVIHHHFESIHPFYDGNGRTGRIINVLYLVKQGLLNSPILYLSGFINQNKADYYRLLQGVRDSKATWEEWVLFMLEAVEDTSLKEIRLIEGIRDLMLSFKRQMRENAPKIYSQDLLNTVFRHPYTKISHVESRLAVTRKTARKYLDELCKIDLMEARKVSNEIFFINTQLYELLCKS